MKRKSIIISVIIIIIIISISIYVIIIQKQDLLGNINHSYDQQTTSSSDFTFDGKIGDKLTNSLVNLINKICKGK